MRAGGLTSGALVALIATLLFYSSSPVFAKNYALLVAAPECDDERLPRLAFAEQDVTRLAALLEQSGYTRDDIALLTPSAGVERGELAPTRGNLWRELDRVLAQPGEGDAVIVVFSGHGAEFVAQDREAPADAATGDAVDSASIRTAGRRSDAPGPFYCPADGAPRRRETLISVAEVCRRMQRDCRAGHKLLLVDACRNDPFQAGEKESIARWQAFRAIPEVAVMFSCSAGELCYEDPRVQHSVFMHFVIEGLRGQADADEDASVTAAELFTYASGRTERHVRQRLGKSQTAEIFGLADDVWVLAIPGGDED